MADSHVERTDDVAAVADVLRQKGMPGDIEALAHEVVTVLGIAFPPGETDSVRRQVRDTYATYGLASATFHYQLCMERDGVKPRLRDARARVTQLCEPSS